MLPLALSVFLAEKRAHLLFTLALLLMGLLHSAEANSSKRAYARAGYGLVEIQADKGTQNWGLQVVIDGLIVGFTPWRGEVPVGNYSLVLRQLGKQDRQHNIYVTDDEKISLNLSNRPCTIYYSSHFYTTDPSICTGEEEALDSESKKFTTSLLSGYAGSLGKGKVVIDLGIGYPNLITTKIYVGFVGSNADNGMAIAAEFRSAAYQNDALVGFRMGGRTGPLQGGADILIGGGGGPRSRRDLVLLHVGMFVNFHLGSRFRIGMGMYAEFTQNQVCPSVAELEALARRGDLQTIANLAEPETPIDACTNLRGRNPIADATGYDPIHHKLSEDLHVYNPSDTNYSIESRDIINHQITDVLSNVSGGKWELSLNLEHSLNQHWNIWVRPMLSMLKNFVYSPRYNPIIPRDGMVTYEGQDLALVFHGQIGITLKI